MSVSGSDTKSFRRSWHWLTLEQTDAAGNIVSGRFIQVMMMSRANKAATRLHYTAFCVYFANQRLSIVGKISARFTDLNAREEFRLAFDEHVSSLLL